MKRLLKIALIIVSLILIIGAAGLYYVKTLFEPVMLDYSGDTISVVIPKGSTPVEIAEILEEKDLIKNKLIFELYVKYTGDDRSLKAGNFELSKDMDLKEIIQLLVKGNTIIESVRFTIPEGYNVKQIAERLSEQGLVNKDIFLKLVKEGNFDFDFIKQIPENKNIEYKLEGFLFPETYEVKKGATEEEIITKMLSQFQKEWKLEWNEIMEEKGMTLHQMVSLASIIEREVVVDKERPIVAGVFYNRLRDSWRLESCATVQFVLGKQREVITYADLEIDSPYNTYQNDGLPPGPIGNPGRKSLEAVVYPEEHDYYFFVTKKDNSGEHYFSKTLTEHLNNDAQSRGNW